MHLLNVDTLGLETFYDAAAPRYAILSHTWTKEEVTFQDIQAPHSPKITSLAGFEKIQKACYQARLDKYKYVWIDTCCIDKSSSAELTEAINSMFQWYREAGVCYVYLSDVKETEFKRTFSRSRWFTRGWTLQELLAPDDVVFYDRDWRYLGTKVEHARWISDITGIDIEALTPSELHGDFTKGALDRFCIAKRMSWASERETTRTEDIAYCLLGIFNINMPLLYGERERAFFRLQEELIKRYDDDSILAWGFDNRTRDLSGRVPSEVIYSICVGWLPTSVLAGSPSDFRDCRNFQYAVTTSTKPLTINNAGVQIDMPLIAVYSYEEDKLQGWVGLLNCSTGIASEFLAIVLCPVGPLRGSSTEVERGTYRASGLGDTHRHTVVVGPRTAMHAKRRTVTIVQQSETRTARAFSTAYCHFVVNESQALLDAGYRVRNASATMNKYLSLASQVAEWDAIAKSLTIKSHFGDYIADDLLCFEFTHSSSSPDFTILLRGEKAVLRQGTSIPEAEQRRSYQYLGEANSTTQGMTLLMHDGSKKVVTVAIRETDLLFSRIYKVNVDITPDDGKMSSTSSDNA